jgi:hypothetical protein
VLDLGEWERQEEGGGEEESAGSVVRWGCAWFFFFFFFFFFFYSLKMSPVPSSFTHGLCEGCEPVDVDFQPVTLLEPERGARDGLDGQPRDDALGRGGADRQRVAREQQMRARPVKGAERVFQRARDILIQLWIMVAVGMVCVCACVWGYV